MPGHRRNRRSRPDRPKLPLPPPAPIDRAWADYSEAFRRDVLPQLLSSGAAVSVWDGDQTDLDVQQATEIGAMLLLGRPLLLVCVPGAVIPDGLRRAADEVVEDFSPDNLAAQDQMAAAMRRLVGDDGETV